MKKYIIAVDLGGTNIKAAIVSQQSIVNSQQSKDQKIKILKKISVATKSYKSKGALIEGLSRLSLELIQSLNIKKGAVAGIGIGAPGLIDSEKGIIRQLVNIKGFREVPLKKLMEKKTGLSVFLDNDVNVMTLGELYHGAGKGARNMLCLTLGTGVGGGVVIDGDLYRGSGLAAGEVGHMPLNETGPACACGGFGCMEKAVGNRYIVSAALKKIRAGRGSVITKLAGGKLDKITPEIIHAAAKKGDAAAISVWRETGAHLGVTLAGVINLLNPDRIVIGGGVAEAGRFLFDAVKKTIRQRAMKIPARQAKVVKARLGKDAGLIGAAVLVRLGK